MLRFSAHDLEQIFDRLVLSRGHGLIKHHAIRGKTVTETRNGTVISARVQGSGPDPYRQQIEIGGEAGHAVISGTCSCPDGPHCKHIAAVLLSLLDEHRRAAHPSPRPPEPREPAVPAGPEEDFAQWLAVLDHTSAAQPYPEAVRHRLLYVLKPADPLGRRVQVSLYQGYLKKSGAMSQLKPWSHPGQRHRESPPVFILPWDRSLIHGLESLAAATGEASYVIGGPHGARMLHLLVETGRCHWLNGETPALTLGAELPLPPQREEVGSPRAHPRLGEGLVLLDCTPPWYLNIFEHTCGPVGAGSAPGGLPVPGPEVDDAPIEPAQLPRREVEGIRPTCRLRLVAERVAAPRRWRSSFHGDSIPAPVAHLDLLYLDQPAPAPVNEPVYVRLGEELVVAQRDLEAERAARDTLRALGLQQPTVIGGIPLEPGDPLRQAWVLPGPDPWVAFVASRLDGLRTAGWIVEVSPDFPYRVARPESWEAQVLETPQQDWFDLELGVVVDGERLSLIPILLDAMQHTPPGADPALRGRHGDAFVVRLADGRLLALPLERVRPLLAILVELQLQAAEGERLRLSKLDTPRLAELDESLPLRWLGGKQLRRLGQRLRDSAGIQPVAAPDGFPVPLRSYQLQGLAWLQFLRQLDMGGVLADDMGLGKTVQTLAHLLLEKRAGRANLPSLVVAPTSLMYNWKAEAARYAPELRVLVLQGAGRKPLFEAMVQHDVVLTTYPLLSRDEELLQAQHFHLLVLDEAHNIKNPKTRAAQVAGSLQARHRLCLTGTPVENNLGELWSLFNFLMPGLLGSEKSFRELYRTPIERGGDVARQQQLARRLAPFLLRRTKEMVATELPAKTEIIRAVELDGPQRDLYETIRISMQQRVRDEVGSRGLAGSQIIVLDALLKLRQVCCDPSLVKLDSARKVSRSAKLELLLDLLHDLLAEGRRILVFSQFTSMLALIEAELEKARIGYVQLTGDTQDRQTPVDRFQRGDVPLFLISLKAGGVGLNLTAADTVIHYDPWWNPAVENQATDRAHRIGQDKPVFVYKLVAAGTVEEKILALQHRKAQLAAGVLDGAGSGSFTPEDIDLLFGPP